MRVRRLGEGDGATVRQLMALFADAFEDPEHYSQRPPTDAYLQRLLARPDFLMFVAASPDGQLLGGLFGYELLKPEQECSEVYLYDLAVREGARRQGVATALIRALQQAACEMGATVVYVQADPEDEPAVALYTGLGRRADVLHFDLLIP